jgi:RNA polymerase sigma factor (sigma-70 family)
LEGEAVVRSGVAIAQVLEESDADLLARIADGDTAALGKFYDRHRHAVVGFAARVSGNQHDADDIAHETFLTVAKIAGTYDGRLSCRPWLFRIAARALSHRRRGAARLAGFLAKLGRIATSDSEDPRDAIAARSESPRIEVALSKLSDAKRVVLIMFEVEEMSGEEIAHALSIPIGTVWTRLHAARRELRARLEVTR